MELERIIGEVPGTTSLQSLYGDVQTAIDELRETLRAIEGDGHRRRPVLPFGIGAIDTRVADGGLRLDALHEVAAKGAGGWPRCCRGPIWARTGSHGRSCGPAWRRLLRRAVCAWSAPIPIAP